MNFISLILQKLGITTQSWADAHAKLAQDAHNTARAADLLGYQMEQASLRRGLE